LIFGLAAEAKVLNIPEIGPHYKIMTFEKNENPQNILVVYTKLDENCRFAVKNGKPLIDFYWLMDGKRYKPTHPLIKDAVRKRLEITKAGPTEFELRVNDLKELNTKADRMAVKVEKDKGGCRIAGYFPDEKNKLIEVDSIYSESKKTLMPPFRKLLAVTIRGTAPDSGEAVQRRFTAR
jgi:hypothetical protein